jgi:hypothetical protein
VRRPPPSRLQRRSFPQCQPQPKVRVSERHVEAGRSVSGLGGERAQGSECRRSLERANDEWAAIRCSGRAAKRTEEGVSGEATAVLYFGTISRALLSRRPGVVT